MFRLGVFDLSELSKAQSTRHTTPETREKFENVTCNNHRSFYIEACRRPSHDYHDIIGCVENEDPKTKTEALRPCGLKRRPTGLKRRPTGVKRRPTGVKRRPTGIKRRPISVTHNI